MRLCSVTRPIQSHTTRQLLISHPELNRVLIVNKSNLGLIKDVFPLSRRMFEKQRNFAEFKEGHKHTQGQANLWLEIIGWVLWLQGEKRHYEERRVPHSSRRTGLHETGHAF